MMRPEEQPRHGAEMPPHAGRRAPRARAAALRAAGLVLGAAVATSAIAAPAIATPGIGSDVYDVVLRDGTALRVVALTCLPERCVLRLEQGVRQVAPIDIDHYETFQRNLGRASNVVAFRTGSIMRFESVRLDGGLVHFDLGDGSTLTVPEAVLDFEASVLEGAMVKLPPSVGWHVAISRPDSSGASPVLGRDGDGASAAGRAFPSPAQRLGRTRRMALAAAAEGGGEPADAPESLEPAAMGGDDSASPWSRSDIGRPSPERPAAGREDQDELSADQVADAGPTHRVVATLGTDYSGDLSGLQVSVVYPARCEVVTPRQGPAFTGFAASMTTAVNVGEGGAGARGPLRIGGFAPPGSPVRGPGDFLRVLFNCRGGEAGPQDLALMNTTASDGEGNLIQDFQVVFRVE